MVALLWPTDLPQSVVKDGDLAGTQKDLTPALSTRGEGGYVGNAIMWNEGGLNRDLRDGRIRRMC
jgi:hypothetical protein